MDFFIMCVCPDLTIITKHFFLKDTLGKVAICIKMEFGKQEIQINLDISKLLILVFWLNMKD